IRLRDAFLEREAGAPASRIDSLVAKVARLHADRTRHVLDPTLFAGRLRDRLHQLRHGHILWTANIRGAFQRRLRESIDAVDHIIDIRIRSDRGPISPYFDRATIQRLSHLAADRGRRFLAAARPGPLGAVAILKASDA